MKVMVMELGTRKEKASWFQCKYEHDSRNTPFQKTANRLVTYEPGPSKTKVDYCL